jgi:parallel beta-helix repeat protein
MGFVTLQDFIVPTWNWGGSVGKLRIYASAPTFESDTGLYIAQGQTTNLSSACYVFDCTVAGTDFRIPEVVLPTTLDSTNPACFFTALLYDASDVMRYPLLSNFFVSPEFFQSPVTSGIYLVSGSSTGTYTARGTTSGKEYYNLIDTATSTSNNAIKWTGSAWIVTNNAGTTLYTSSDAVATPDLVVTWTLGVGIAPLPVVTSVDVATWEQLILSNGGFAVIPNPTYPGPFWNTSQTIQYINAQIGTGTTPYASTIVAGKTQLDTAPDLPQVPIAVGVNSPLVTKLSVFKVLSLDYANDLPTAITAIGSTQTTLYITVDTTLSTSVTIPSTLTLLFQGNAKIIKASSGAIAFQGIGLTNPTSQTPCFSGFSAGNITWTGSTYPSQISSWLWDSTDWGLRLSRACGAFTSKQVQIEAYSLGTPTAQIRIKSGQTVHFNRGTYENAIDTGALSGQPSVILESDVSVYGDGIGQTIIKESSVSGQVRGWYGTSVVPSINPSLNGFNENISITNITFLGQNTQAIDSAASCIFLGNVTNGIIRRCEFNGVHGFGAYVGAFASAGHHAINCYIDHNIFSDLKTQNCGAISGKDIFIESNLFTNMQTDVGNPFAVAIDVEPNSSGEYVSNIQIINNIIDARGAVQSCAGIDLQIGGSDTHPEFCRIAGNIIIGQETDLPETGNLVFGIVVSSGRSCIVEDNLVIGAGQQGISVDGCSDLDIRNNTLTNCGGGGTNSLLLNNTTTSRINNNSAVAMAGFAALASLGESGTASNTYNYNQFQQGYTLSGSGTSYWLSDQQRTISNWIAPTAISSNQNNYNPGVQAYRLDLASDASRNLTGLVFTLTQQNGEKHWIVNVGTNPIVLKHQSGSSTSANRFFCNTGADITLAANESAHIEYNSSSFWFVVKDLAAIGTGDLPTGIPATNIANGTVSNTEFQYLDGVTSAIQTQFGAKMATNFSNATAAPSAFAYTATGINFNSANTDTAITITLPSGFTRYIVNNVAISHASGTLTTSTVGLFTATGGGGVAIFTPGTAVTVSTASENTSGNAQSIAGAILSINAGTLYFRVQTPQGTAATADVTIAVRALP